ncbi:MAG TPA: nucleotidyltransferase domain-containing protein [Candidatus Nanoarchaeia archaeon]|nr:nucleotidyltransferase domain-containing protein [Candidatus Nanoarchaeia archaeon]
MTNTYPMNQRNELISYALDFTSHLIGKTEGINRVILFGSLARGDFDSESDIDLFIDTIDKKFESRIPKIVESYYASTKAKNWNLKGVKREISCVVGELDSEEWKDLKRAIINTGIILYGKYHGAVEKVHHYLILSYGPIRSESKRVSAHRSLYGFTVGKTKYTGLVEKYHAVKLGTGCLMIPLEHAMKMKKFFQERKVPLKLYDVWSDSKIME